MDAFFHLRQMGRLRGSIDNIGQIVLFGFLNQRFIVLSHQRVVFQSEGGAIGGTDKKDLTVNADFGDEVRLPFNEKSVAFFTFAKCVFHLLSMPHFTAKLFVFDLQFPGSLGNPFFEFFIQIQKTAFLVPLGAQCICKMVNFFEPKRFLNINEFVCRGDFRPQYLQDCNRHIP